MREPLHLTEANLPEYFEKSGILGSASGARVEPAGEGNINWVRRVRAGGRSWVVKQARPALERFPEYRASTERIAFERRYYARVAPFDPTGVCPRIHHFDPERCALVLEDLGAAERFDAALARGADVTAPARAIGAFLGRVHAGTRDPGLAGEFGNGEMQRLHGDHIFHLPYRENDFPLSDAVRERAVRIWDDAALVGTIDAAYRRYLTPEGALVHADVQPTNVLLAERGPVLLDAEIAHVGDPAFDVGIWIAHLWLAAVARGDAARGAAVATAVWDAYADAHGARGLAPFADVARYAGIELLRRTLGAARVEAVGEDAAALAVIDAGERLVREPPEAPAGLARHAS